jgi:hypothetical protein
MKIEMRNIQRTFAKLYASLRDEEARTVELGSKALLKSLKEATPVDTGKASAGWKLRKLSKHKYALENNVEYVEYLNQGSSAQAPKNFIELAALKHGKPSGSIVEVR